MSRHGYGELLAQMELRNPEAFIWAVIRRHFESWRRELGIPEDELFHEGVVALWKARDDYEVREEGNGCSFSTFAYTRIRWHLRNYIESNYVRFDAEMPLADFSRDEEDEYYLENQLFTHPQELDFRFEFQDLLDRIMEVLKKQGVQGAGRTKLRAGVEEKYRRLLTMAACDANGTEIAEELGYRDRHSVNRALRSIKESLFADEEFMAEFGHFIEGRRLNRRGMRMTPHAGDSKIKPREARIYADFASMSVEEIQQTYGVTQKTARQAQRRGWLCPTATRPGAGRPKAVAEAEAEAEAVA